MPGDTGDEGRAATDAFFAPRMDSGVSLDGGATTL